MLEYSLITWVLIAGLVLGFTARIVPVPPNEKKSLLDLFLGAIQVHYESVFFVLNLPFP